MPITPQKPLTKKQKAEIWKLFWFHAIGAAVFIPFVVVASNVGVMADTHIVLKSVILGIPNFLVWARFASKSREYQESTGIPYPSTYFALAVGSFVFIVGPLLMFLFLLIRMSRIPTIAEPNDDTAEELAKPSAATCSVERDQKLQAAAASERQARKEPFVVQKQPVVASESPNSTIMKPDPEDQPSASPVIDDEPFYEEVAKEIESDAMKPGLWTKAFAEAQGNNSRSKVIYIRLRVAQLIAAKEAEIKELQCLEKERIAAEEHARFVENRVRLEAAQDDVARREAVELEKHLAARDADKEEVDRAEAAKLELKIKIVEADEARLEVCKEDAILADPERFQESQDAIRRMQTELGNIRHYPAKVSIGRNFIYLFKKYDLIIGPEEILFIPLDGDRKETILVSPKLGDRIQTRGILAFDVDARVELENGTLLRLKLSEETLNALIAFEGSSH